MRKNLTVKAVEALKPALPGKRYDVGDAIVPGFGVRVNDKGQKSYMLIARYPGRSNPTRRTISRVGAMDLAGARHVAREWIEKIHAGIDPLQEAQKKQAELRPATFAAVAESFTKQHVERNALRSAPEIKRLIKRELLPRWEKREFETIRRGDVARLLDDIEKRAPSQADHVLALLSKMCNWYMAREEDYTSPIVRGMRRTKPAERARKRILNDDELCCFWEATKGEGVYGAFLRTALLTAQRRTKVLTMNWDDIGNDGV